MCEDKERKYINIQNNTEIDYNVVSKLKDNMMLKVNPHLFEIWNFNKNKELDIYNVSKGSDLLAEWICIKCRDTYSLSIQSKDRGYGCPMCSGKRVTINNCLATKRPDLLEIWCKDKNDINPFEILPGSSKKAWWYCSVCEESYLMVINKKNIGRGCSICSGYNVTKKNSFGGKFPEIASQWHPTKNGQLTPYDVSKRSSKKSLVEM